MAKEKKAKKKTTSKATKTRKTKNTKVKTAKPKRIEEPTFTSAFDAKDYIPSEKEIRNGEKVLEILQEIEDIGYTIHRPDLFTIEEPEFGLEINIDAEEDVICLIAEVCDVKHLETEVPQWEKELLKLNNMLLHGAFSIHEGNILLRENLAAENLDPNELEDAISAMFAGIIRYAKVLKLA